MGTKTGMGFTVIEVMLFLAVTGFLAVAILVGSGIAIGQQRYRDSVISLQSYIQQQYNEVTNVTNTRDQGWTCDGLGNVTATPTGQARGTSDCTILGRYITVDASGTHLTGSDVVGAYKANAVTQSSDIAEITTNYNLGISPINQDAQVVSWGAQIVKPKTTLPMPLSILVIRSPLSGSVLTFISNGVQSNLMALVAIANMNTQHDLCVNADIGTFMGKRMEVRFIPYATSQSAVQVPIESDSVCD